MTRQDHVRQGETKKKGKASKNRPDQERQAQSR